ncbi:MAG: S1 RNA-binding domain-containing protein [Candidatus Promineifilaceae bacterium]
MPAPNPHQAPLDDAYWHSLFREEETMSVISPPARSHHPLTASPLLPEEKQAQRADGWAAAEKSFREDELLELEVIGFNKGGLLVSWYNLQGFIPASQLNHLHNLHQEVERARELEGHLGQRLYLKIIELDRMRNRLILSERMAVRKATDRTQLLQTIHPGDILHGRVTNFTQFGVFVDLGGVEGLLHISELSWGRVEHPGDLVQPEQLITVKVLSVDRVGQRIALSIKQLRPDPWAGVEKRYAPGQEVRGIVSRVVNFGAFIQVEEELEGLVHTSELADGSFLHPRDVLRQGEQVVARVLQVDGRGRRLALSLKMNNIQ